MSAETRRALVARIGEDSPPLTAAELATWSHADILLVIRNLHNAVARQAKFCRGTGLADYAAVPCPNPECPMVEAGS